MDQITFLLFIIKASFVFCNNSTLNLYAMRVNFDDKWATLIKTGSLIIPLLLFWLILIFGLPASFSQYFHSYSPASFLIVLFLYFICFRLTGSGQILSCLALTMVLLALSLSYIWTSGFSDNFIISGLLPYKDAKNYYVGANLLLDGLPMVGAGQATERPLFPGLLGVLLWFTRQDLRIAIGIMTQLVGIGICISTRQVLRPFGALAAGLFATLLYFYIQPLIGYSLSEMLGFFAGCLGFSMLMLAAVSRKWTDLLLGTAVLMVAVSARAGAFMIFPMLALWAGWIFRGEGWISLKSAAYFMLAILGVYYLVNIVYSLLLDIPAGSSFANFSYALYGQVRGGTGWHSAIQELGTRNPSIVYRAAWEFFQQHPASLLIGFVKSYRDFFMPGDRSILPYLKLRYDGLHWLDAVLWLSLMVLLFLGFVWLVKNIRSNTASLISVGVAGIFLSIPFLPPIDGGARFYAGTMPFFFAVPAAGVAQLWAGGQQHGASSVEHQGDLSFSRFISVVLLILVLFAPLMIYQFGEKPAYSAIACSQQDKPFAIEVHPGSYVDLVNNPSVDCSTASSICLGDFKRKNAEKEVDDYYQHLLAYVEKENVGVRIVPAIDLMTNKFHYFYFSMDKLIVEPFLGTIIGCATESRTKNQSIYQVESIFLNDN